MNAAALLLRTNLANLRVTEGPTEVHQGIGQTRGPGAFEESFRSLALW